MNPDSLVGATLDGRYDIVQVLGGGGMGCVYEALHSGTGRRVAVKVISTGDIAKNKALVGRFQREAKAAGSIDTQHIAQVLDTGTDRETALPYMVMEYLSGEDLQQLLRRTGPLSPELALRMAAQVCLGLQKAHEARVIHRDIKPANIYMARREQGEIVVKVLDFGIAKVKAEEADATELAGLTRTGSMLGSPLYMSPEQARGLKTIDHRADLWSLGVVLYEALAGRTPNQHIEALGELILEICSTPPRPVQEFAPWVSPEIAAVVHRVLRFDPADRFQSAAEMLEAIKPLLSSGHSITEAMLVPMSAEEKAEVASKVTVFEQQPLARRPSVPPPSPDGTGSRASLPSLPSAGTTDGLAQSASPPRSSGSSWKLVLAVAAVVLVGGIGGMKLLSGSAPAAPPPVVEAPHEPPPPLPAETAPPAVTPAVADRTVKLVVLPEDVKVEVDGTETRVKNGVIEIIGAPGSVHKVKLTSGANESVEDVVVTESGALPPKVQLKIEKPHVRGPLPPPKGPSSNTSAPKPAGGIDRTFE